MAPLDKEEIIRSPLATFALSYPFSAFFVVALGLPTFLLLRPFRPGRWWSVLVVGLLLGGAVAIAVRGHLYLPDLLLDGPLGSASALAFWLVWRRGLDVNARRGSAEA
jgi:hypothetical protein